VRVCKVAFDVVGEVVGGDCRRVVAG